MALKRVDEDINRWNQVAMTARCHRVLGLGADLMHTLHALFTLLALAALINAQTETITAK